MSNQLKMADIQAILSLRAQGRSFREIARQLGVHGFPALIGQQGDFYAPISSGYCSFEELNPKILQWWDA